MKIGPLEPQPTALPVAGERKAAAPAAPAAPAAAAAPAEPSARVELSSVAASWMSDGDGSFDAAKVERIAQAIRDGKFQVDAQAIADRLIANAQELLSRGSSVR